MRPLSRGTVSLSSATRLISLKIAPNYLSDNEDQQVAVESHSKARELMATNEMAVFEPEEFCPGKHFISLKN